MNNIPWPDSLFAQFRNIVIIRTVTVEIKDSPYLPIVAWTDDIIAIATLMLYDRLPSLSDIIPRLFGLNGSEFSLDKFTTNR